MKVRARCGYCLLHRGYNSILKATTDESLRFKTMRELLRLLGEGLEPDAVPSHLGSKRDRLIKQITRTPDPYAKMKLNANEEALRLIPELEKLVNTMPQSKRFRTTCKIACIGNIIEYDVPDHNPDIEDALTHFEYEGFYIDDIDRFEELLYPGIKVLLLTDNAGEIAFDRLVVRELRNLGCSVTVAVKGGPSLNDALVEDAEMVGMKEEANILITTGADAIGVNLEEISNEFKNAFYSTDIIISKGMANWETLTEYSAPCPTLFLFRTKCEPVAASVGAPLHKNIAKLIPKDWHL